MRASRLLASIKSRYACAVVAKPPGTDTPAPARLLIISPREAILPPTRSTSWLPSLSREITYSTKVISPRLYGQGKCNLLALLGENESQCRLTTCLVKNQPIITEKRPRLKAFGNYETYSFFYL